MSLCVAMICSQASQTAATSPFLEPFGGQLVVESVRRRRAALRQYLVVAARGLPAKEDPPPIAAHLLRLLTLPPGGACQTRCSHPNCSQFWSTCAGACSSELS